VMQRIEITLTFARGGPLFLVTSFGNERPDCFMHCLRRRDQNGQMKFIARPNQP
jgi:hypothetical protein